MPNRTVCSALDEMRACIKTSNFSYLIGLIEEIQTMVNRMEESLYDKYDYNALRDEIKTLKKERDKLKEKK